MPAKIHLHLTTQANKSTPSFTYSDLPYQEYLLQSSASSKSTLSRFHATKISAYEQSFVTDYQQTWLTQPQSPRLPTPVSTTATSTIPDLTSDFVLFPSPLPASPHSERVPATARTDPNCSPGSTFTGQRQTVILSQRRNSDQQIQSSRLIPQVVSNCIGGSPVISSNGLHACPHSRTRPPVPLFANNLSGNINQLPHTPGVSAYHTQHSLQLESKTPPELTMYTDMDYFHFDEFEDSAGGAMEDNTMDSHYSTMNNLSSHTSSTSLQTASPHDIFYTPSAPPSAAFSNLTTPETRFLDSPNVYLYDDSETHNIEDLDPSFTLFGDVPDFFNREAMKQQSTMQNLSQAYTIESPSAIDALEDAPEMSRTTSSTGKPSSRSSQQGRQSSTSGVSKRRAKSDLPPITVQNPNDVIAIKRARNTMAARKSRDRRATHIDELEIDNARLLKENAELRAQVDQLNAIAEAHRQR